MLISILLSIFLISLNFSSELKQEIFNDPKMEKSNHRREVVNDLSELCNEMREASLELSSTCKHALEDYFIERPIWMYARYVIYSGNHSELGYTLLHDRDTYLSFSESDFLLNKVPLWKDIFTDDFSETERIAIETLNDDTCLLLLKDNSIRPEFEKDCNSLELFLYSTYLDYCITGMRRWYQTHTEFYDSQVRYEHSKDRIDEFFADEKHLSLTNLKEGNLLNGWLLDKCRPFNIRTINEESTDDDLYGRESIGLHEMANLLRDMVNVAIEISAKSGNEWAIQTFVPPDPRENPDYWISLKKINPTLMHRWLATSITITTLSDQDRFIHGIMAFQLDRELMKEKYKLDFRRYMNKLTLSGPFVEPLFKEFTELVHSEGFSINEYEDIVKFPF